MIRMRVVVALVLSLVAALSGQTPTLSKEYISLGERIIAMETCVPLLSGIPA